MDRFTAHVGLRANASGFSCRCLNAAANRKVLLPSSAWGGNPEEVTCLNVVPPQHDGTMVHKLSVKSVPVDGFWSISVYIAQGYLRKIRTMPTAQQHGEEKRGRPIMKDRNYMVRLYRPRAEILSGKWKFLEAQPAG